MNNAKGIYRCCCCFVCFSIGVTFFARGRGKKPRLVMTDVFIHAPLLPVQGLITVLFCVQITGATFTLRPDTSIHSIVSIVLEILGLMSPVHRSNSNMDASGSGLALGASGDEENSALRRRYHQSYDPPFDRMGPVDSQNMQRSFSMPPSMFEIKKASSLEGITKTTGGEEASSGKVHRRRMLESQSEDELTTSEGREGDVELSEDGLEIKNGAGNAKSAGGGRSDGGVALVPSDTSRPRARRNAFRGNPVRTRRATCAADGIIAAAAGSARQNVAGPVQEESRTG